MIVNIDSTVDFEKLENILLQKGYILTYVDEGEFILKKNYLNKEFFCKCGKPAVIKHDGQEVCAKHFWEIL